MRGAVRRSWVAAGALVLSACAGEDPAPVGEGFRVMAVAPEDGEPAALEMAVPELRLSGVADAERCDGRSVRLDALEDDAVVAFPVEVAVEVGDDGRKVRLVHPEPLPGGWTYALSVRGGPDGCADASGDDIVPFRSTFTVVAPTE